MMIMNNTYDVIMNALGYDIMSDIIYSFYQTGAYIIRNYIYKCPTKNHTGSRSRKKLESTATVDSLLQLDSCRH